MWHVFLVIVVHLFAWSSEVSAWNAIKFPAFPVLEYEVKGAAKQDILIIFIMKNNTSHPSKQRPRQIVEQNKTLSLSI